MQFDPRPVKEGFALIEPAAARATAYFYGRLFAAHPHLRALFPPAMNAQRERLFRALTRIVWSLDCPQGLATDLARLGRDHRKYGLAPAHYAAVGDALLATVRRFAAEAWSSEMERAWATAYATAAEIMIEAAAADTSPPCWPAEVIGHERRTGDIAVLTLRPALPFPFLPGQYATVQTARWPRVWRAFSIADAPRADNTLRLHVRAVPGGWVSTALTRRTRVGDTPTLGPARGSMTAPAASGRDILAVAGGTGPASLKAIIESVLTEDVPGPEDRRPHAHLLYGARNGGGLYDLPDLIRMRAHHARLRVLPVVSADHAYEGLRGTLPEAISWRDHDAFLCGPPAMVGKAAQRLRQDGLPPVRIHHDHHPTEP
ncbi:flavohemoprotein [Spongiactinospora gelatinilytica]|uniref:nitric oxide dioxygenase n=1 Tax=Spongiactinospora gelatinilytica TaxID=2666298 RepID=A0A2W2F947_9ACTN|nr:globin domain-containing protein [Spongiactinospora gelatinilytica]PZG18117.1 flavohemoprotein [Spongiactinospora gelatinilytica]